MTTVETLLSLLALQLAHGTLLSHRIFLVLHESHWDHQQMHRLSNVKRQYATYRTLGLCAIERHIHVFAFVHFLCLLSEPGTEDGEVEVGGSEDGIHGRRPRWSMSFIKMSHFISLHLINTAVGCVIRLQQSKSMRRNPRPYFRQQDMFLASIECIWVQGYAQSRAQAWAWPHFRFALFAFSPPLRYDRTAVWALAPPSSWSPLACAIWTSGLRGLRCESPVCHIRRLFVM